MDMFFHFGIHAHRFNLQSCQDVPGSAVPAIAESPCPKPCRILSEDENNQDIGFQNRVP